MNRRVFALAGFGPAYLSATDRASDGRRVWESVPHWLELACVPGAVAAVLTHGQVERIHSFGLRRFDGTATIDADTIFEAASLSKPVFAAGVLRLVREKLLDLNRPLHEMVPLTSDPRSRSITARHVLSHTGGLPNWRGNGDLRFIGSPGEKFSYSGEGYFYLQRVIEKITATPFARYMRESVLGPLGMARSRYFWQPDDNSAAPHDYRGQVRGQFRASSGRQLAEISSEWKKPMEDWFFEDVESALKRTNISAVPDNMQPNAAATLMTTAAEYSKFLLHFASLRSLHEPQVRVNDDLSWGLGCGLEASKRRWNLWHHGDNPGFKNFFMLDPETKSGILIFTNGDGGMKLYSRVARLVLGQDPSALLWV